MRMWSPGGTLWPSATSCPSSVATKLPGGGAGAAGAAGADAVAAGLSLPAGSPAERLPHSALSPTALGGANSAAQADPPPPGDAAQEAFLVRLEHHMGTPSPMPALRPLAASSPLAAASPARRPLPAVAAVGGAAVPLVTARVRLAPRAPALASLPVPAAPAPLHPAAVEGEGAAELLRGLGLDDAVATLSEELRGELAALLGLGAAADAT